MKKLLICAAILSAVVCWGQDKIPLKVAVAGVAHGHVGEITSAAARGEADVIGIFEKDPAVRAANQLCQMYPDRVYDDPDKMPDKTKPEAAMVYGSVYDHLSVVEACAPRGIHVMVEKPLAVNGDHARRMAFLARKHGIHLLTNYETTWYPTNHRAYELVAGGQIGDITRRRYTAVVRGEIMPSPDDLPALENNLTVVDILDAARESARARKVVVLF